MTMRPRASESHSGQWYLTDAPDRAVPGVLKIDDSGRTTLEVIGELEDMWAEPRKKISAERRIFGTVAAGSGVTLRGCFVLRTEGGVGGPAKQIWHANEAIFGVKFDSQEPWAFYGTAIEMPALTTWVQRAQHDLSIEHDESGRVAKIGIAAETRSWPLWAYNDGYVELRRIVRTTQPLEGLTEFESKIVAHAAFKTLKASDQFHDAMVRPLQLLLGIATSEFTGPVSAQACVEPVGSNGRGDYTRWQREPLEVSINPLRVEYAFHYSDFAALSNANDWIGTHTRYEAVWSLYLSAIKRTGPLEMQFLFAIQALEAFHRLASASTGGIPSLSKPASSKGKALKLRDRLHELLRSLGSSVDKMCGCSRDDFVSLTVKARNYFTHWDTASGTRPLNNEELVYHTWRLLTLMELLLASMIGFSQDSTVWERILLRRVRRIPVSIAP
jgi:hypothetical protein